jgi:hypothetical protein
VYLEYVISGGELKINPTKMGAIMKWMAPTNVIEVRSFVGAVTGVFGVCDRWRGAQDRSHKDGGHLEMASSY